MGVNIIVARDSICVQEIARDISGTRAMGGDSDSHHGGSLWFSLSLLVEKFKRPIQVLVYMEYKE